MSDTSNANPFVLPGMGQSSDLSGNPLLASMEMMRQAWAGLAGPGGLAQVLPMGSPLNTDELERRIAELRAVESWLRMNLSMLGSTIQGMEVQRATIATLRSFVDKVSTGSPSASPDADAPSPLEVVLGLKPAPAPQADKDAKAAEADDAPAGQDDAPADSAPFNAAAHSASQAWWNLLQQQFSNIAAATTASMAGVQPAAPAQPQAGTAQAADPAASGGPAKSASVKSASKPASKKPAAKAARKKPAARGAARKAAAPSSSQS